MEIIKIIMVPAMIILGLLLAVIILIVAAILLPEIRPYFVQACGHFKNHIQKVFE